MLNSLNYSLPAELEAAVQEAFDEWKTDNKIRRVWSKDQTVWTNEDEAKWLAWLDSIDAELKKTDEYKNFAEEAREFESVVLLGMGGSSLGPEVLAETFGKKQFHILDSTVPAQIKRLESKIDLAKTLFIVASKSGSTLEPNTFKQYFFERVSETIGSEKAGKHFVAITDPGSKMQQIAESDRFGKIFFGNPEIGGRFSALSPFGMAAGAAMGLDVEEFLKRAQEMATACKNENPAENPGTVLGSVLGVCNQNGRDKLTIFTSSEIRDTGAWLEQLIAESTGKEGKAIIPVDLEEISKPENYGDDRVFVYLKLKNSIDDSLDSKVALLRDSGCPVIEIVLGDRMNLGQEFFRWEFATAVAGAMMKINPFNQPDVEAAKVETRKLTEEYETNGELPDERPFYEADGIKLFTSEEYADSLDKGVEGEKSIKKYLQSHLAHIQENDYFALLAYVERNPEHQEILQAIRHRVFEKKLVATCLGFGPRFLHSTGQAYKGGANNGVFLQITSDDAEDFNVPGQKYTFGVVKQAQARGDFQVLVDRDRRALRVHLSADLEKDLKNLLNLV